MNGIRAMVTCLQSVVAGDEEHEVEQRVDLRNLVGEEVVSVEPYCGGVRFRFGSGAAFVALSGSIFDSAGNPVIEP